MGTKKRTNKERNTGDSSTAKGTLAVLQERRSDNEPFVFSIISMPAPCKPRATSLSKIAAPY